MAPCRPVLLAANEEPGEELPDQKIVGRMPPGPVDDAQGFMAIALFKRGRSPLDESLDLHRAGCPETGAELSIDIVGKLCHPTRATDAPHPLGECVKLSAPLGRPTLLFGQADTHDRASDFPEPRSTRKRCVTLPRVATMLLLPLVTRRHPAGFAERSHVVA